MRAPTQLRSGRWQVRFRYGSTTAGQPKQTSETFATKRDAVRFSRWLDALGPALALAKLYDGELTGDVPTLTQVAGAHIEHLTGVEPGTRLSYTRLWARTWGPLIGGLPADAVTKDAISRAINDLAARYSAKSLKNQRGLLAGVCQRAVENGYLTANPTKGIRVARGQEQDRVEMRIVTPDEFAELIARVPTHYQPLVMFLYGTGCRWGEAVAITVGDVTPPLARIRRALKWSPDNNRQIGATKTVRSNRTIELPQQVIDVLDLDRPGGELLFTAPRGGPVLHRTFWSRVWLPAVGDMVPRPRIHDLRHSQASIQLASGRPIHEVSALLGHENIQTTVNTYGHLMPTARAAAAQAASLAFSSLSPKALEPPRS